MSLETRLTTKKNQLKARPLSPCAFINLKRMFIYSTLMLSVLASALGVVYTKHQSRSFYARVSHLQHQRDDLHVEWSQLLLERGAWANDARVERIAREELGMELPSANQVVMIRP